MKNEYEKKESINEYFKQEKSKINAKTNLKLFITYKVIG